MKNRTVAILLALLILLIFATACVSGAPSVTTPAATTALDGATLVQERCSVCHPLNRIMGAHYSATEWKAVVDKMIAHGAQLTPEEETVVVNYLSATYGKSPVCNKNTLAPEHFSRERVLILRRLQFVDDLGSLPYRR